MKKHIKAISVALSTLLIASSSFALTGCGEKKSNKPDESQVTYIRIQSYDCGYGREFLDEMAKDFTEAVKEKSYEEGKKGVYVDVSYATSNSTGSYLMTDVPNNVNDVFVTSGMTPQLLSANKHNLMDLQGIVGEKSGDDGASQFAEEKSIGERMEKTFYDYFKNADGSFYTIPLFYNAYMTYYDADLVKDEKLFIKEGSTDTRLVLTGNVAEASNGVDGIKGTDDDGLPETYAQYFLWLDKVKEKGIIPMHGAGLYPQHYTFALNQFVADFEGKEKYSGMYDLNGEVTFDDLVKNYEIDANGNVKVTEYYDPMTVDTSNGYMVQRAEGKLQALNVAEKLGKNYSKYFHSYSFSPSENHTGAQATFIASAYDSNRILSFVEGIYWESEASPVFKSYENRKGGKLDRNFKVMPTPKATRELVGSRSTVAVQSGLEMVVKAGISGGKLDAVKDFVSFFNKESNMGKQNNLTGTPRPFTYSISDETKANMSTLQKSIYGLFHSENTDVAFSGSKEPFFTANADYMDLYYWALCTDSDNESASYSTIKGFKDGTFTLKQYFDGLTTRLTKDNNKKWNEMLNRVG